MKYTGLFHSIINDIEYKVEIQTSGSGDASINLGPSPFVTNMDQSSATMYTPVKYQSAQVQIATDTSTGAYLFDLYSSKAKDNTVKLYDTSTGDLLFSGYTSPNIYTAPYDHITEIYNLEVLDGLSILQYYDYEPIGETKDFATFAQIINKLLTTAGCYSNWYFTQSIHVPDSSDNVSVLTISEQNFFDEDDTPMKMNQVLEEICKFMNVTCVGFGDEVYFMNYDAIKAGINTYWKYSVRGSSPTSVTLSDSQNITKESYAATGASLSLAMTYSKVTIKDSLYDVDSIIPSLFEDEDLVNVQATPSPFSDSITNPNWMAAASVQQVYDPGDKEKKEDDDTWFYMKSRHYINKKYNHYYYSNSGTRNDSLGPIMNGKDAENKLGAAFSKYNIGQGQTFTKATNDLSYDNYQNYLMLPVNRSFVTGKKKLETNDAFTKPFFTSGKTKFIVKGSMIFVDRGTYRQTKVNKNEIDTGYFPVTGVLHSDYDGNWWKGNTLTITKSCLQLRMGLKLDSSEQVTDVPFFPYGEGSEQLKEKKNQHEIFFTSFEVQDNVSESDGVKEDGYKLVTGLSADKVVAVKPILTLYGADLLVGLFVPSGLQNSVLGCVFIKDFDIVAKVPAQNGNAGDDEVNGTDTEYSYVIDDAYVSELSPIEFKICTYDNKQLNYSAVAYKADGTNYSFLDNLVDDALSLEKKAEELLCYRIVKQYQNPAKKLSLNLFNQYKPYSKIHENWLNVNMIIDNMNIDYVNDKAEINLIEKK